MTINFSLRGGWRVLSQRGNVLGKGENWSGVHQLRHENKSGQAGEEEERCSDRVGQYFDLSLSLHRPFIAICFPSCIFSM